MSKKIFLLFRQVLPTLALCLLLAAPAFADPAHAPASGEDKIHSELVFFAKNHIAKMNKYLASSIDKKEVSQNPDGSYTARYSEYDVNSLQCSYKTPSGKDLKYIGSMQYCELTFESNGATAEAAKNGKFVVAKRKNLNELIGHSGGKWRLPGN